MSGLGVGAPGIFIDTPWARSAWMAAALRAPMGRPRAAST